MNPFEVIPIALEPLGEFNGEYSLSRALNTALFATNVDQAIRLECADLCGNELFVGLADGTVAHFILDPLISEEQKVESQLKSRVAVSNLKTPCSSIIAVPSEDKLLVQTDSYLNVLSLKELKSVLPSIRGITAYCCDSNIQSPLEIVVSARKTLTIYQLDSRLILSKNIATSETYLAICKHGRHICGADDKIYQLLSVKKEISIPLFPYDSSNMSPLVYAIRNDEFLLLTASAQGFGIGVFVSAKGEPVRGTLQWPAIPIGIVYYDPYVVALLQNSTIQIHNIETQMLVQSISLNTNYIPKFLKLATYTMDIHRKEPLNGVDGKIVNIIFGSDHELFGLVMRSWDFQLAELFDSNQIDYALALLKKVTNNGESDSQMNRRQIFYCRAGFAFYTKLNFDQALEYFKKCKIPPLYLIKLFIGDPKTQQFANDSSPFAMFARNAGNFKELVQKNIKSPIEKRGYKFLLDYLIFARDVLEFKEQLPEVDNALLFVYTITNSNNLKEFAMGQNFCTPDYCSPVLIEHGKHYVLSLLYKRENNYTKVLDIWTQIASGDLHDPDFGDISQIVNYLKYLHNKDLVLKYGAWVLSRDPINGVQIFIDREDELFTDEQIFTFLDPYSTSAKKAFLEHVVITKRDETKRFHQQLAILYFQEILRLADFSIMEELNLVFQASFAKDTTFLEFLRERRDPLCLSRVCFYDFVSKSKVLDSVELSTFFNMNNENRQDFFLERVAILILGQDFLQVLKILVNDLQDSVWAEQICMSDPSFLLEPLLALYLNFPLRDYSNEVSKLISTHIKYLDIAKLVETLPPNWSLKLLMQILTSQFKILTAKKNKLKVSLSFSKSKHSSLRQDWYLIQDLGAISVQSNTKCVICGLSISNDPFSLGVNGLFHQKCR